jgi:chemotaxis protein histidine kinase CheA
MKKFLTPALAVIAVIAIVLCFVFAGQRGEKAEDVTAKISKAVEDAKNAAAGEKDEAVAAAMAAADEAVKAAQGQVDELNTKLADAENAAKTAAETAAKEKDDALAALKAEDEAALKNAQEAADKVKAELEEKVAGLTKEVEDVKAAGEKALADAKAEAEKVQAELQGKVDDLTKQLSDAAATAKEAVTETVEGAKEDVTETVEGAKEAVAETAATAAEEVKETVEEAKETVEETAAAATEEVAAAAEEVKETAEEAKEAVAEAAEEPVMTYSDYVAAELDSKVHVETYVQATQSWWDGKITIYAQSEDGAYFIYNAACTEEDAAKLVPGTKIGVKGFKSEWSGEVEITDATIEILEGDAFIAEAHDDTALLGKDDELIKHQNEKVAFKGLTVAAQDDGAAFNYKNAENKTDDLYVRFTKDDVTVNFCVEFYLCNNDTEVYKAVEALQVGDVVDIEGFLYWYNGANVHLTAVTKAAENSLSRRT